MRTLEWTEEDTEIVNQYMKAFYHIGYPMEVAFSKEVISNANGDDVLDCSMGEVYHPFAKLHINIVGRDH